MSLLDTIKNVVLVPTHPKGKPIIAIVIAITLGLFFFAAEAGYIGIILTVFCIYFFRNPDRFVPQGEGFVLATGDGVISHVSKAQLPEELGEDTSEYHKISIFLNVFNVHVNRLPATGKILNHIYIQGKFLNASLDKASKYNERTVSVMENNAGEKIGFSQIAGFVARRIIHEIKKGDLAIQGERYGIIRFGSRCDIYIPLEYDLLVDVGTTAIGGETMLAVNSKIYNSKSLTWKKV